MTGSKKRLIAIAGAVALSATALGACGGGGGGTVSADQYVGSVCSALGDLQTSVQSDVSSFQQVVGSAGKDPAAVRDQLSGAVSDLASSMQDTAKKIQDAGTPDVPNGDQIASQVNDAMDKVTTSLRDAQGKVSSIPTDSPQAFQSGVQSFVSGFQQDVSQITSVDPTAGSTELQQAASQNSECQSLGGGSTGATGP